MVIPESYLMHHGVKGQKWGVRRYQNPDGTLTAAGRKRYGTAEVYEKATTYENAKKAYDKSFDDYYSKRNQAYSFNKEKRRANTERLNKAHTDAEEMEKAKKEYKQAYSEHRKEAVKKYKAAFNKTAIAQQKHDEAKLKVDELYESLGSSDLSRNLTALASASPAAKRYNKAVDEWVNAESKLDAELDAEWKQVSKLYRDTGRSYAERVFNNIRYR